MDIGWTKVGEKHTETQEDKNRVSEAIERMDWFDPKGKELAMMPGMGISEAIRELRMPRVQRVAVSNELAPYGLYGIEALYKNGLGRVYIVDEGSSLVPVGSHLIDTDRRPRDSQDVRHKEGVSA